MKNIHSVNIWALIYQNHKRKCVFSFLKKWVFLMLVRRLFPSLIYCPMKSPVRYYFLYKTLICLCYRKQKSSLSIILFLIFQDLLLLTLRCSAPSCKTTYQMILSTNINTLNSYHSHLPLPLRWVVGESVQERQIVSLFILTLFFHNKSSY